MRVLPLLLILGLAGCTQATATLTGTRAGNRTFEIHGPPVPGGSEAPNRRLAIRLCPDGYRVIDKSQHSDDRGAILIDWTIRCI